MIFKSKYYFSIYVVLLIILLSIGYLISFRIDFWGDEKHFVETIELFANSNLFEVVIDYPEVTPPLFYFLYSIWGKLFGLDLYILRILSLLFGISSFILLFKFFNSTIENKMVVFLSSIFVIINPYLLGASIFVFTDILAFSFLILFLISMKQDVIWLMFLSAVGCLLTRQYLIFIISSASLYYLLIYVLTRNNISLKYLTLLVISLFPLLFFMILWKGIAPPSGIKRWTVDGPVGYSLAYLITYISLLTVYALPFLLITAIRIYSKKRVIISFILSLIYFKAPVTVSPVALEQTDVITVGYFHRLIKLILPGIFYEHVTFIIMFFAALPFILFILEDIYKKIRIKEIDLVLFFNLSIIFFLIVMPASYQVWEKYLIPIVPLFAARMLIFYNEGRKLG